MFQKMMTSALALLSVFIHTDSSNDKQVKNLDLQKVVKLNQETKKSMASSWIELPDACKAKNFNADPIIKDRTVHSKEVLSIFSALS
ncbi:MAG: hypothetical protein H6621_10850 [Halobacteriovoraceae bacterium]|nr:hypothetical protein [Halobacteriovoraceae bacterium]MCB9095556.1 hypothetical protein [Halobacteriovoraceae bacterium]